MTEDELARLHKERGAADDYEPSGTHADAYTDGWNDALDALRDTPVADTAGIDAAWAEAEAALPEGWRLSVAQHPDNCAAFATSGLVTRGGAPVGLGPTPAAALLALAAALRTPKPEGEPDVSRVKDIERSGYNPPYPGLVMNDPDAGL